MKLIEQVTSVETSRKLLAAGVDCQTGLVHVRWKTRNPEWEVIARTTANGKRDSSADIIPAFTAPELMDGTGINLRQYHDADHNWMWCARVRTGGNRQRLKYDANPAEAVAALILAQFAVEETDV